jgi:hypothetical protein
MPGPGIGIADIGSIVADGFALRDRLVVADAVFDKTLATAAVFDKMASFIITVAPED